MSSAATLAHSCIALLILLGLVSWGATLNQDDFVIPQTKYLSYQLLELRVGIETTGCMGLFEEHL